MTTGWFEVYLQAERNMVTRSLEFLGELLHEGVDFGPTTRVPLSRREAFREAKARAFVARIEELITPRDMYLMGCISGFHNAHYLYHEWPFIFIMVVDEICDAFLTFTNWKFVRTPGLPDTNAAEEKNNEWMHHRELLLRQIRNRIEFAWQNFPREIDYFFQERALRKWKKIRRHVKLQSIVWYWVHVANKPGSVGYYRGMIETCG